MKRIFFLFFLIAVGLQSVAQITDNTLLIQSNQIKNETTPGANTANRVGTLFANLSNSKVNIIYGVTAGGTDTYTATVNETVVTYVTGQHFLLYFTNANTGAATINLNSIGAASIVKNGSEALAAGDIPAGSYHILAYDGTNFQLVGKDDGGSGTALGQKTETGTTYTVTDADDNYVIHISNASGCTVTLPNTISDDTYITFIRDVGAGVVTFSAGGTSVFYTLGDEVTIDEEKAWVSWLKDGATDWYGAGGLGPTGAGTAFADITGDPSDNANLDAALDAKAPVASPTFTGTPAAPTAAASTNSTQIATTAFVKASSPKVLVVAASDETTALTTGTGKITFRMPYAMTVTAVRASLTTAQTAGSILTVDINEGGTTILSTKITIDDSEKTSTTAATAAVISDTSIADDAEITVDIDQVGTSPAGLKVTLIGY